MGATHRQLPIYTDCPERLNLHSSTCVFILQDFSVENDRSTMQSELYLEKIINMYECYLLKLFHCCFPPTSRQRAVSIILYIPFKQINVRNIYSCLANNCIEYIKHILTYLPRKNPPH